MNAVNNLVRLYLHNHSHPLGSLAGLTIEETIKFAALDAPPPFDDNGVAKGCPFALQFHLAHETRFPSGAP
jgi:hypothetical protein